MNMKFFAAIIAALLLIQTGPVFGQQIPASELPRPGTDTGLEGKYDPTNGIAQLIQDKSAESAASQDIRGRSCAGLHAAAGGRGGRAGPRAGGSKAVGGAKFVGPQAGGDVCPARCGSKSWDRTEKRTGSNRFQSAVK